MVVASGNSVCPIVLEPDENGKTADQEVTGSPQNALTVVGVKTTENLRGDVKNLIKRTQENSSQNLDQILENPPLIIVDGEKMSKDFELNSINPDEIQSMSVLKDKSAIEIYGEEGKNGVIIITKKVSDQNP